ncbi:hypothetical protein Taro_045268 [Colocasia esculenta]|uniref:Uncharacterized protein n=1 Tax=Colocasia esculenta TaxID=4460 RepID=A0A843WP09_COLES|nr:hypothetical protein [Colocasia esculenta]
MQIDHHRNNRSRSGRFIFLPPKALAGIFWRSLLAWAYTSNGTLGCVDTTTECVDTLSQLRKEGLLDAGSSVDTTMDCVDTLDPVFRKCFRDYDPVSTPSMGVSTLP